MKARCSCGSASLELRPVDAAALSPLVLAALLRTRGAEWFEAHVLDVGRRVGVYAIAGEHRRVA